jgi:hypothetical protein
MQMLLDMPACLFSERTLGSDDDDFVSGRSDSEGYVE